MRGRLDYLPYSVKKTPTSFFIRAIIVLFAASTLSIQAQQAPVATFLRDSLSNNNNAYRFGFDKIANTFVFMGDAVLSTPIYGGEFFLSQQYRGSTVRSTSSAFRDDENIAITYRYRILPWIQPFARAQLQYSKDSRSIGITSTERLVAVGGAIVSDTSLATVNMYAGIEKNTQVSQRDIGVTAGLSSIFQPIITDVYKIVPSFVSEVSSFRERINADATAALTIIRSTDAENEIVFSNIYRILRRDFYAQSLVAGQLDQQRLTLESRVEKRLNTEVQMRFSVAEHLRSEIYTTFSQTVVNRDYTRANEDVINTGIQRTLTESSYLFNPSLIWFTPTHELNLSLFLSQRNEENVATPRYSFVNELQFDTLRTLERLRNNSTQRTRISLQHRYSISNSMTVDNSISANLLRYDTPSTLNQDDRDELQLSWLGNMILPLSASTRLTLTGQFNATHMVFLKSERSAINNWNRIFKVTPRIDVSFATFQMHPTFELLAQYTVYDYEGKVGVPSSFSYRQVAYRDSIIWQFHRLLSFESQLYFRYFLRGELYWKDFAEIPINSNYEQYVRVMLTHTFDGNSISTGVRMYALSQGLANATDASSTTLQSIAPEVVMLFNIRKSLRCSIQGWYEFQFLQKIPSRQVPNVRCIITQEL